MLKLKSQVSGENAERSLFLLCSVWPGGWNGVMEMLYCHHIFSRRSQSLITRRVRPKALARRIAGQASY